MASTNVEKELLELEKKYWQAIKDRDTATAMSLSDDPCIVAGAQGVGAMNRNSLGKMMESAPYELHDFTIADVKVRLIGDDVAVLAYRVHEELSVDGQPLSVDCVDASTWVRKNGSWVCALHTEAIAGDPFGRDRKH